MVQGLPKPVLQFKLGDPNLFGNDAADLESEALFNSYAVLRSELQELLNSENAIQVTRAYKGEGKSALLRLLRRRLSAPPAEELVITAIGPDHSPVVEGVDSDRWTREWKKSLLKLVANEIGSRLGVAFSDDAISLVEEAEANGFKKRSFVSAIVDRLSSAHVPLERTRLPASNYARLVGRYVNQRPLIWIVIDDIDQNFTNTEKWRVKLGSFFTACRQIISAIPELRIRTAVRPNVWAIIKREFESLSHIEQYMHDLTWTEQQFRQLIAMRVRAYLQRTDQWRLISPTLPHDVAAAELVLIATVFDAPMPWGGGGRTRPPHLALWTLTGHRPRWLVELCKQAGKAAEKRDAKRINLDDIKSQLAAFGRKRIEDTEAEFKSQCPQIAELLGAFSRQLDIYSTDELLKTIHNRILGAVNPVLTGHTGKVGDLEIAHFLYQIGFLAGRRDYGDGDSYDHVLYRESPTLLKSRTNIDDGLRWEINPIYREVLNLRSVGDKRHTKSGRR